MGRSNIFLYYLPQMKLTRCILRTFTASSRTHQSDVNSINVDSILAIKMLHAQLLRTEQHTDPSSISDVIRHYSLTPTTVHKALLLFRQIERPPLSIWNFLIRGLSLSDRPIDALQLFDEMREQGFRGNDFTFVSVFKACAKVQNLVHGLKVHAHVMKLGCEFYLYVGNALIHMYASSSELGFARKVFEQIPEQDLVSWNSLICGYAQCNMYDEVIGLFDAMRGENVKPDAVTMVKVMLACSYIGDMELADSMTKYIEDSGLKIDVYLGNTMIDMYGRRGLVGLARGIFDSMPEKNVVSWNAMITGYAKAKDLVAAKKLFDEMPKKDVISWSAMITGYSISKQHENAVKLFGEMMTAKVKPDEITIASVLSACARLGSLDVGLAVHEYIHAHNIKADLYIGNSLIDMYCKCGSVQKALEVFREMKKKDSISWTSVISGLAVNGCANDALELFSQMLKEGFKATHGTFVGLLLACAHAGLVDKGLEYFRSMENDFGLRPEKKHYGCVVDLLSRSGYLDRAYEFIKQMPVEPDDVVWRILLSSCKVHKNVALAEIATNKLLELDPSNSGAYVLSANTYADADRWDDAMKLRALMDETDVQKQTGWSSLEANVQLRSNIEPKHKRK